MQHLRSRATVEFSPCHLHHLACWCWSLSNKDSPYLAHRCCSAPLKDSSHLAHWCDSAPLKDHVSESLFLIAFLERDCRGWVPVVFAQRIRPSCPEALLRRVRFAACCLKEAFGWQQFLNQITPKGTAEQIRRESECIYFSGKRKETRTEPRSGKNLGAEKNLGAKKLFPFAYNLCFGSIV